jgi:hypothetical protein
MLRHLCAVLFISRHLYAVFCKLQHLCAVLLCCGTYMPSSLRCGTYDPSYVRCCTYDQSSVFSGTYVPSVRAAPMFRLTLPHLCAVLCMLRPLCAIALRCGTYLRYVAAPMCRLIYVAAPMCRHMYVATLICRLTCGIYVPSYVRATLMCRFL